MAQRLYGIGKTPSGGYTYTATIHDSSWSGALTQVDVAAGGITIKADTSKTDDRHAPIMGTTANIKMICKVGDTILATFLEDVRTSAEGRFWLEITSDIGLAVVWRGIIIADNSWETDEGARFEANISAVDGLALLKKVPYYLPGTPPTIYTGTNKIVSHITRVISKMAHQSLWGATDPILETSVDWWADAMSATAANDPLALTYADNAAFYDYHTTGGVDKDVLSCFDVLTNILITFGCRMYQYAGLFRVEQIDYRANSTYIYRWYDKSANYLLNATHSGTNTINQSVTGAKLSYVTYDYLPQISKSQLSYKANLRRNFWGNILLSEGVTYNFNQVISSNSGAATFRIQGNFFVNIKNNTYSGNPQDVIFAEMQLSLKIGSNYLKRSGTYSGGPTGFAWHPDAPTWSASGLDHCKIVSQGWQVTPVGLSHSYIFNFDLITAPLPSDGSANFVSVTLGQLSRNNNQSVTESEFTISWTAGSMWMEVYDLGTPDVSVDEILYESNNPAGGTNVWESTTVLGGGSANYAGRLMNSSNVPYALWGAGVGARDKPIGAVVTQTVMNGQLRGMKRMNGQIYGVFDPFKLMSTSDGIDWLPMAFEWSVTEDVISGTWVEVDYGSTAVAATPIPVKFIPNTGGGHPIVISPGGSGFSGNGNSEFSNNSPATAIGPIVWNTISSPVSLGATITTISLSTASSGNDFLAGDEVSLAHPISGRYQVFVIATAPTAGATSLSVTSATAEFDAPVGSFLVIRQKPFSFSLPVGTHSGQILWWNGTSWVVYGTNSLNDGEVLTWTDAGGWLSAAPTGGYTDEQAQDAVGNILTDSTTIDFTYNDGANTITAIVIDNSITLAKMAQVVTAIFLGRTTAGTGNVEAMTATQATALLNLFSSTLKGLVPLSGGGTTNYLRADGSWAAPPGAGIQQSGTLVNNRVAISAGSNLIKDFAAFTVDGINGRLIVMGLIAGLGASSAHLYIAVPAGSSTTGLGIEGAVSGSLTAILSNTSTASTANMLLALYVGGSAAADPFIQFQVSGIVTHSFGLDNSDADKIKITPGATTPGGTANHGLIITNDATPLVGINKDAPAHPLDVVGRVKSSTGFIGSFAQWVAGNIVPGAGAGTGWTLNSISGTDNALYVSFTTGTTPTANGTIFTATYPNSWPSIAFVTFSADSTNNSATDIAKFRTGGRTAAKFDFVANGTLTASTNYQFCFSIFGM